MPSPSATFSPLDGYITYVQLRSTAGRFPESAGEPTLKHETGQFEAMTEDGEWATADPLGLGGLLADAYRVQQLMRQGGMAGERLLDTLLTAALAGLHDYAASGELRQPAEYRLAFRELGLAIGLHAVRWMREGLDRDPREASNQVGVRLRLDALSKFEPLGDGIESFWRNPMHRRARTWSEHRDINEVMLATSLAPEGFLVLLPQATGPAPKGKSGITMPKIDIP